VVVALSVYERVRQLIGSWLPMPFRQLISENAPGVTREVEPVAVMTVIDLQLCREIHEPANGRYLSKPTSHEAAASAIALLTTTHTAVPLPLPHHATVRFTSTLWWGGRKLNFAVYLQRRVVSPLHAGGLILVRDTWRIFFRVTDER